MILVLCFLPPLIQMNLVVAEADASHKCWSSSLRCAHRVRAAMRRRPTPCPCHIGLNRTFIALFLLSRRLRQRWRIGATPTPRQMNLTRVAFSYARRPQPQPHPATCRLQRHSSINGSIRHAAQNPGRSSDAASQLNSYFPSH